MTTNIDRAAEVIHDHHDNCLDAANALADAGLLTPDHVKPSRAEIDGYALWKLDHIDISAEAEIGKVYVDGNDITPEQARAEAAALLAAANHAEKDIAE